MRQTKCQERRPTEGMSPKNIPVSSNAKDFAHLCPRLYSPRLQNLDSPRPPRPFPPLITVAVLLDSPPLAHFLHISDNFVNACAESVRLLLVTLASGVLYLGISQLRKCIRFDKKDQKSPYCMR